MNLIPRRDVSLRNRHNIFAFVYVNGLSYGHRASTNCKEHANFLTMRWNHQLRELGTEYI